MSNAAVQANSTPPFRLSSALRFGQGVGADHESLPSRPSDGKAAQMDDAALAGSRRLRDLNRLSNRARRPRNTFRTMQSKPF